MVLALSALRVAADDPAALVAFWSALLDVEPGPDGRLWPSPAAAGGLAVEFVTGTASQRTVHHLDLTSDSVAGQEELVARALRLGAHHHDVGQSGRQSGEEGHVVLADPEGNAFCVIEAGNGFLAGCGPVGALNCDGTRAVGLFWSAALTWPLVWDQGEETAIQSPRGGPKITWSGPPLAPRHGPDRWQFDLTTSAAELDDEVARLVSLGASVTGSADGVVVLTDPDGGAFRLRGPRGA